MAKVDGLNRLVQKLRAREREAARASKTVVVGYTSNYAVYVHEDLEAHHPVGQAKYLEQPDRENANELAEVVRTAYQRTGDMERALLLGGLRLQRLSQELVPVDTGVLRASAFTEVG